MADNYGMLPGSPNCFTFIPPNSRHNMNMRFIDGGTFEVGGLPNGETHTTHPGGDVIFLVEKASTLDPSHFPITIIAPSIVTVSPYDVEELRVDVENRPTDSANWPGVDLVLKCPKCRGSAKCDGKTQYVLALVPAITKGYRGSVAAKLLWRLFCVGCFEGMCAHHDGICYQEETGSLIRGFTMDFVRWGRCAPFDENQKITPLTPFVPGGTPCGMFERTSAMVRSGLHVMIGSDFMAYLNRSMGGKGNLTVGRDNSSSKFNLKKLIDRCNNSACGKSAIEAYEGVLGNEVVPKLLKCGSCNQAQYCSKECQKVDWKRHKADCKVLVAERAQKAVEKTEAEATAVGNESKTGKKKNIKK